VSDMIVPRTLRPVAQPLGAYFRPNRNDNADVLELLAEGRFIGSGFVVSPRLLHRQDDLLEEARRQGTEVVLDTLTLELSTVGGFAQSGMSDVPWAQLVHPGMTSLGTSAVRQLANSIATYAIANHVTAVLSPAHFLDPRGPDWLGVDVEVHRALREELDAGGGEEIALYFPLATSARTLREELFLERVVDSLSDARPDAVWLRVHPFGTTSSGPLALRRYIEACRGLLSLDVPLVAERSGTIGIALLAFGAVGGIESGITFGERFDYGPLLRPRTSKPFLPPPRIYLAEIGAFLERRDAEALFEVRGMRGSLGCQERGCCERGVRDMLLHPRQHFIIRRTREVASLSNVPTPLRPGTYMETFLRPASDRAIRAAAVAPSLNRNRQRLDAWRGTLGAIHEADMTSSWRQSRAPEGRRIHRTAG
jgi:hypothetical protein